jgi:hypothetical protein
VRIGRERELRHEEEIAADVPHGKIHLACLVGKDAQGIYLSGQSIRLRVGVSALYADQRENAAANRTYDLPFNGHARFGDALQQSDHAIVKASIKR